MKRTAFRYLLGGIALGSELPLPELPLAERATNLPADVNIVIGEVPQVLPQAIEVDAGCFASSSEYLLHVPGVASYRVSNGCEIVIQPDAGALEQDVRGYLLGSIFAVLCHQRGLLPLHASAVAYQGGVAAFLANSGHGKSSIAAHLAGRGFPVVADDVCLVDVRGEAPAVVVPVAPWLKLWADSLEHLGLPAAGLEQIFSDEAKYRLPTECVLDETAPEPRRIAKVVFLEGREEIQSGSGAVNVEMRRLAPLEALPMLISLTHQSHLLEAMGLRTQNFLQCGRVASQAAVYRLIRPWGLEHMEASIDSIENLLREV
jgi:hypothetical protein